MYKKKHVQRLLDKYYKMYQINILTKISHVLYHEFQFSHH